MKGGRIPIHPSRLSGQTSEALIAVVRRVEVGLVAEAVVEGV